MSTAALEFLALFTQRNKADREKQKELQALQAEKAKAAADHRNAINLEREKSALTAQREALAAQRKIQEAGITNKIVKYPDGNIDVVRTLPGQQVTLPKGTTTLAIGQGTSGDYQDIASLIPFVKPPLYELANGARGTAAELRSRFPSFDLELKREIGNIDRDGNRNYFDQANLDVVNGLRFKSTLAVGNTEFPDDEKGFKDSLDAGKKQNIVPVRVTQQVNMFGKPIGLPTRKEISSVTRALDANVVDVMAYSVIDKTGDKNLFLSQKEFDELKTKKKLTNEDFAEISSYTAKKNVATGEIIQDSYVLKSVTYGKEASITRKMYVLPDPSGDGYLDPMPIKEARETSKRLGYDWNETAWFSFDQTKKGDDISETNVTFNEVSSRVVGEITLNNGNKVLVSARSRFNLEESYPGVLILGKGKIVKEDGVKVFEADDPLKVETKKDIQLTLSNGTKVLASEATSEEQQNAVSQVPVDVDLSGKVIQVTGTSSASTARQQQEAHVGTLVVGGLHMGPKTAARGTSKLDQMHSKLNRSNLSLINEEETTSEQYINEFAALIESGFTEFNIDRETALLKNPLAVVRPRARNLYKFVSDKYPNFLLIKGMDAEIRKRAGIKAKKELDSTVAAANQAASTGDAVVGGMLNLSAPMDDDPIENSNVNSAEQGNETASLAARIPADVSQFVTTTLKSEILSASGQGEDGNNKANLKLINLLAKKVNRITGEYMVGPNGVAEISSNQPVIRSFQKMNGIFLDRVDGISLFNQFIAAVNGEREDVSVSDFQQIGNSLIGAINKNGGGIRRAVEVVAPFIKTGPLEENAMSPTNVEDGIMAYLNPDFGGANNVALLQAARENGLPPFATGGTEKAFIAKLGKKEAGLRVINYSNTLLDGYFEKDAAGLPTGRFTQATAIANVGLKFDGLLYLKEEGEKLLRTFMGNGDEEQIYSTLVGNIDEYKDQLNDRFSQLDPRYKSISNEGRNRLNRELRLIAKDMAEAGNDEQKQAYAVRQLYIVNLAYELSAMMQGGTGGRTISDQDVAIILSALRQGFLSSPRSQAAVIMEVRSIAQDMVAEMEYATSGNLRTLAAYSFVKSLSAVSDMGLHRRITPEMLASRIRGAAQETSDLQKSPTMNLSTADYNKRLLDEVNENRVSQGKPSLEFGENEEITRESILNKLGGERGPSQGEKDYLNSIERTVRRSIMAQEQT